MKRTGPPKRKTRLSPISEKRREGLAARVEWRLATFERARRKCERCGWKGEPHTLDPHHLWPAGRGGPTELWNSAALCRGCHDAVTEHRCPDWRAWLASNEQEARGIRATLNKGRTL